MSGLSVTISVSDAQVAKVLRDAAAESTFNMVVTGTADVEELQQAVLPLLDDPAYSRSTISALLVLNAFSGDGTARKITSVARQLKQSPSTAHRYANTLCAFGLLEQEPVSRQYRRPTRGT